MLGPGSNMNRDQRRPTARASVQVNAQVQRSARLNPGTGPRGDMAREEDPESSGPCASSPPGEGAPRPGNGAEGAAVEPRRPNKSSKQVYFAVLPEKYEPLLEEEEDEESQVERRRRKEGKKTRTREVRKKRMKTLGRALRWTWRCMVAGLQSLAGVYSAPFTATTTLSATWSKA